MGSRRKHAQHDGQRGALPVKHQATMKNHAHGEQDQPGKDRHGEVLTRLNTAATPENVRQPGKE